MALRKQHVAPLGRRRGATARAAAWALAVTAMVAPIVALTGPVSPTQAQRPAPSGNIDCRFDTGTVRQLRGGAFVAKSAAALSFTIGQIDLTAQTAALVTDDGTDTLRIVRAINANHFLEVVTEGFLNVTTIYDPVDDSGNYPAVHSRHFGLLGQPIVAQYSGFCRPA